MLAKTRHPSAGRLAEAKQGFERWRRGRKGRRPIPDRLWRMAAEAAAIHGVHATARELRLNSTRLREQLRTFGSEETPGFVEFPWPGATPVAECILEAEDQAGRKLRIQLKGSAMAQAAALSRLLWESGG